MSGFVKHDQALVESKAIGVGTQIGAFTHVLAGATIGENCNIRDHVYVENNVIVGDRVTINCGVQLWDGLRVEDDVLVGPNVTFTNDAHPIHTQTSGRAETVVRKGAVIGANATILPGLTIGQNAMVGAGAVVTHSVPPYAVVVGNPARIVRYTDDTVHADQGTGMRVNGGRAGAGTPIVVRGVRIVEAPIVYDMRGNLAAREVNRGLPFVPQRTFVIFDVPSKEVRGAHAHRQCEQFLVCLNGTVAVVCDDGERRQEIELTSPEQGLYLPPMVWGIQYKYSADAVLLVYASHPYDAADYIRDYDLFMAEVGKYRSST